MFWIIIGGKKYCTISALFQIEIGWVVLRSQLDSSLPVLIKWWGRIRQFVTFLTSLMAGKSMLWFWGNLSRSIMATKRYGKSLRTTNKRARLQWNVKLFCEKRLGASKPTQPTSKVRVQDASRLQSVAASGVLRPNEHVIFNYGTHSLQFAFEAALNHFCNCDYEES